MAVFPERLVLKNSSDTDAEIRAAIETGGVDAITQGEIVIGLTSGDVKLYSKDADGNIVTLGSGSGAQVLDQLADVDISTVPPTEGQALLYDAASGEWLPGTVSTDLVGSINDLTDVDTSSNAPADGQALVWNASQSEWSPADQTGSGGGLAFWGGGDFDTGTSDGQPADGGLFT